MPMMYCPECKELVACSVPPNPTSDDWVFPRSTHQQLTRTEYPDIHYFERLRVCDEEGHEHVTFEIEDRFVYELIHLRELVERFGADTSALTKESKRLAKLSKRLASDKPNASISSLAAGTHQEAAHPDAVPQNPQST